MITRELALEELKLSQAQNKLTEIVANQVLEFIEKWTVNLDVISKVQDFAANYLLNVDLNNIVDTNTSPLVLINYAVLEGTRIERVTRSDFRVNSLFTPH